MVLLNVDEQRLIVTSKWTTTLHHSKRDASSNTHLQSFDRPSGVEEEQPSLETPTWHTGIIQDIQDGQPENWLKICHFWTLNGP